MTIHPIRQWTATSLTLVIALSAPVLGPPAAAQQPRPLSLQRALEVARENNPAHLATRNDRHVADWDVRQSYGDLLPSASANGSVSWQGAGEQRFGSLTAEQLGFADQPSFYFSSYSLGLSYQLDGRRLMAPGQAKEARERTDARIRASEVSLGRDVTLGYLEGLRQAEEMILAEQELERARFNLRLARAQRDVGQVTPLDVQQAEVQVGRAEVTLLRAENARRTAHLRLLQQMGVRPEGELTLTSDFGLAAPPWEETALFERALDRNPTLRSRIEAREVEEYGVRMARSQYWPSLSVGANWSGFTRQASSTDFMIAQAQSQVAAQIGQCEAQNELFRRLADPLPTQDCTRFAFTDDRRRSIVENNDVFPFSFESSPPSASMTVSLPIFQGLSRQRGIEAAEAARSDADYQVREQELALRAEIAIGLSEVETAYQSALIEQDNQRYADEQLRLARERYRVGGISFIDLVEAETVKAQADRSRLNAVFSYHDAVTNLEAVVGSPLRDGPGEARR